MFLSKGKKQRNPWIKEWHFDYKIYLLLKDINHWNCHEYLFFKKIFWLFYSLIIFLSYLNFFLNYSLHIKSSSR